MLLLLVLLISGGSFVSDKHKREVWLEWSRVIFKV